MDETPDESQEALETDADQASAEVALTEYRRHGGTTAQAFFASLATDTEPTDGPDKE
jgi:hypothetical protein